MRRYRRDSKAKIFVEWNIAAQGPSTVIIFEKLYSYCNLIDRATDVYSYTYAIRSLRYEKEAKFSKGLSRKHCQSTVSLSAETKSLAGGEFALHLNFFNKVPGQMLINLTNLQKNPKEMVPFAENELIPYPSTRATEVFFLSLWTKFEVEKNQLPPKVSRKEVNLRTGWKNVRISLVKKFTRLVNRIPTWMFRAFFF